MSEMTVTSDMPAGCRWCSGAYSVVMHWGPCPRVKAIEYHPDGSVKRVEFHADPPPAPLVADPKLVTHLIGSGTAVPPPYDEPVNFGGGIESVQQIDGSRSERSDG